MTYEQVAKRAEPVIAATLLIQSVAIWRTSTILDLGLFGGRSARVLLLVYCAALAAVIAQPSRRLHVWVMPLSILVLGGRTSAFLVLVADGRTDLWGSVCERFTILTLVCLWHLLRILVVR